MGSCRSVARCRSPRQRSVPRCLARGARRLNDDAIKPILLEVFNSNYQVYGRRKMKAALRRVHGLNVDKDRIARLMRELGIRGATRSKTTVTTRPDRNSPRAPDLVKRQFRAERPNQLWVSDFERHEAFLNLAVVKGHCHQFVAADWLKLRAA